MKRPVGLIAIALIALFSINTVLAQAYPNRTITIVIPNLPGSPYEPAIRLVTPEMQKRLGQPIVIEYKPGAGQIVGANFVLNAKPDGYTLLYASMLGLNPLVLKNNSIDAAKQLSPISAYAYTPYIIFGSTRFKNLEDALAYSKANPNQLKWGSPTPAVDLMLGLVKYATGLTGYIVPYKGSPQVTTALLAGDIDFGSGTSTGIASMVQAGKLNAFLVTSSKRTPVLPNVPSAGELGYQDLTSLGFTQGLWGPPGLPKDIAQKLSAEVMRVLKTPEAAKYLLGSLGADTLGTTPEEQLRLFEDEMKWLIKAVKLLNFQPQ